MLKYYTLSFQKLCFLCELKRASLIPVSSQVICASLWLCGCRPHETCRAPKRKKKRTQKKENWTAQSLRNFAQPRLQQVRPRRKYQTKDQVLLSPAAPYQVMVAPESSEFRIIKATELPHNSRSLFFWAKNSPSKSLMRHLVCKVSPLLKSHLHTSFSQDTQGPQPVQ